MSFEKRPQEELNFVDSAQIPFQANWDFKLVSEYLFYILCEIYNFRLVISHSFMINIYFIIVNYYT